MGTIVVHAGMPKAGSSAVQQFLRRNADAIRAEAGTQLLVFRRPHDGEPGGLEPYERGSINSGAIWFRYLFAERDPAVFQPFFGALDAAARDHGRVLLSSEAFASPLAELEPTFVEGLARMADGHEVRVAYYVRAQQEALEAAWRQWGFRAGIGPADYLRRRARMLDYDATRRGVAALAPAVSFELRRFALDRERPDGLVDDFVRHYLPGLSTSTRRAAAPANPGLPLDVVNVLRYAPPGLFWESPDDNARLHRIKALFAGTEVADSAAVVASRERLHRVCHARYEAGNRAVAEAMGWAVPDLITAPGDDHTVDDDFDFVDELWESQLDERARELCFTALRSALDGDQVACSEVIAAFVRSP